KAMSRNALASGSSEDRLLSDSTDQPTLEPDASALRLMNSPFTTPPSPLLEGRDLTFRHARRTEPVLRGIDLTIHRGDRILLEGPSGGGKSTLAALLAGSRATQAGVLLLQGLDRQTLGMAWRRRVVLAPQFHHNHVLMGTFLYNLLLGRTWPPSAQDVADAERLCHALDLGPLIDRMPGGLLQIVGETGWQLSHGEKSRLFLARALLQQADVVLLDETFAALDPDTLSRTLPHVVAHASTLLVIAHP
ncbi:MAG: ABC transporter ATP-binding protein, partial [Planctomycetota bacterium]